MSRITLPNNSDVSVMGSRIMRRIYLVWFFRRLWQPAIWRLFLVGGGLWGLTSLVSFGSVWQNTPSNFGGASLYAWQAFWQTEFLVQGLIFVLALASFWLGRDSIRILVGVYRRVVS